MTRRTVAALVSLAALVAALWFVGDDGPGANRPRPAPNIQEDDPGRDCRTMGNRVCGKAGA